MKAVAVVGSKNSGKTPLVEYFIERFVRDGYMVAAVKHIHHHFTIDTENKDTWRMARKGAQVVASISPNEMAIMFHDRNELVYNLDRLQKILASEGIDLIIFEGFHMVLGSRPDVYKILTIKDSEEIDLFLQSLKPPIIAVVNNSGKQVTKTNLPVYTQPLSEELYLITKKALKLA